LKKIIFTLIISVFLAPGCKRKKEKKIVEKAEQKTNKKPPVKPVMKQVMKPLVKKIPEVKKNKKIIAKQMDKKLFKSTIKKPSYGILNKLVKNEKVENVNVWSIRSLGGKRFITVVTGRNKGSKITWFKILSIEKKGKNWVKLIDFTFDKPKFSSLAGKGKVGAEIRVGDYDWDNKPEALIRYRFPTGGKGDGEIRKIAIINLEEKIAKPAVIFVLSDNCEKCGIKQSGYFLKKDLNKDIFPDLLVNLVIKGDVFVEENKKSIKKSKSYKTEYSYIYDEKLDIYSLKYKINTLPPSMKIVMGDIGIEKGNSIGLMMANPNPSGCMDGGCINIWGIPAISRDGSYIVMSSEPPIFPSYLPAPGFAEGVSGVRVDLVDVSKQKIKKTVYIIDFGIRNSAYTDAQDLKCLSYEPKEDEPHDSRLCESTPARTKLALIEAKKTIRARIKKIANMLNGIFFTPLFYPSYIDKKYICKSQKGIAIKQTEIMKKIKIDLLKCPEETILLSREIVKKKYICIINPVVDLKRNHIIFQIMDFNPPDDYEFRYIINKVPKLKNIVEP
jgi:hypothetical protein